MGMDGGGNRFSTTSISQRCVDSQSQDVLKIGYTEGAGYSRLHEENSRKNIQGFIGSGNYTLSRIFYDDWVVDDTEKA